MIVYSGTEINQNAKAKVLGEFMVLNVIDKVSLRVKFLRR